MRKNISLIVLGSSILALPASLAQDAKLASKESKQEPAFAQALAEATRLSDTEEGKAYDQEFAKVAASRVSDAVSECVKDLGLRVNFEVVFVFAADGHVEQVLTSSDKPAVKCVGDKLHDLHLPAPPRPSWPVQLSIHLTPDKASASLAAALKLMETGTWEVNATISRGKKMRVHGLLAGEDFDLTLEPEDRNAVRQIAIKDEVWASFDGGKTWKLQSASEQTPFRRIYAFVHNPLRSEPASTALEVVKDETRDGETRMHLRRKISGRKKSEFQQTEYWIVLSRDPKRNGVQRYEGPVTEPGHEKEPLHCVATYQRVTDKTIQPPGNTAASPSEQSAPSSSPAASSSAESALESSNSSLSANGGAKETTVSLLEGKLKLDVPSDFSRDADDPKSPKTLAKFTGPDGAWGEVLRGTHGLTPDKLEGYLKMRVAEYSKGFNWLPKDSHLQWLKKDIVTIDGRKWADWRYVPMLKGTKDYSHSPVYTRFLTTSYKGQLLEITFTSNLNTAPELKQEIDRIMDSVHLEE
jgi:hypothetical protein